MAVSGIGVLLVVFIPCHKLGGRQGRELIGCLQVPAAGLLVYAIHCLPIGCRSCLRCTSRSCGGWTIRSISGSSCIPPVFPLGCNIFSPETQSQVFQHILRLYAVGALFYFKGRCFILSFSCIIRHPEGQTRDGGDGYSSYDIFVIVIIACVDALSIYNCHTVAKAKGILITAAYHNAYVPEAAPLRAELCGDVIDRLCPENRDSVRSPFKTL